MDTNTPSTSQTSLDPNVLLNTVVIEQLEKAFIGIIIKHFLPGTNLNRVIYKIEDAFEIMRENHCQMKPDFIKESLNGEDPAISH